MEKANNAEQMMGEIIVDSAETVVEIPFSSPRRSGPVALLTANEMET